MIFIFRNSRELEITFIHYIRKNLKFSYNLNKIPISPKCLYDFVAGWVALIILQNDGKLKCLQCRLLKIIVMLLLVMSG